jgi:hypothetical protein
VTAPQEEKASLPLDRVLWIGLAWLALFSLLYTLGEENGAWPRLSTGGLGDLDLFVGLPAGAVLVALLSKKGTDLFSGKGGVSAVFEK